MQFNYFFTDYFKIAPKKRMNRLTIYVAGLKLLLIQVT